MNSKPKKFSSAGTTAAMFLASRLPERTPAITPTQPMSRPCNAKVAMITRREKPSVRRIAIPGRLSVTIITSVATILKAATATINDSSRVIMTFSMRTARK